MGASGWQRPALVRQHEEGAPAGLLAEWLRARGIPAVLSRSWRGGPLPDPAQHAFVVSLGSRHGARDAGVPLVAGELELLRRAVARDVPVLGLCFGGQALAVALGGDVEPAPVPELGWTVVETDAPALVAPGPWLEWHLERFAVPPGAVELARTAHAPQAFRYGPHLGVQFHPEATPEIVAGWAAEDRQRLLDLGVDDVAALLATPAERRAAAAQAAFALFDGFLAGAGLGEAVEGGAGAGLRGAAQGGPGAGLGGAAEGGAGAPPARPPRAA